jgi:hypothetical protein
MGGQHFFHFARPDLISADFDQLLLAVHDEEVAVAVHAGDVAGEQPSVAQGVGCLGGHVVIALHHHRAADRKLAHFTHWQHRHAIIQADDACIDARQRQPDRAGDIAAVKWVAVRGRGSLREAVALHQLTAGEALEGFLRLAHEGSGARDARADRIDLVLARAHIRVVVDRVVQCWHAGEDGRAELLDRPQQIVQVARVGDHDHRDGAGHGQAHARHHAIDMEERDGHE